MSLLFGLILPLVLIFIPTMFQIYFTNKRIQHQSKLSLSSIFFIAFIAGVFIPMIAFKISVDTITSDWPKGQPKCLTGFVAIPLIGYFVDIIGCITIAVVGRILYQKPMEIPTSTTVLNTNNEKVYNKIYYKNSVGDIMIEQEYHYPNNGEKVYLNNNIAPDGEYKLGFCNKIKVINGIIIK